MFCCQNDSGSLSGTARMASCLPPSRATSGPCPAGRRPSRGNCGRTCSQVHCSASRKHFSVSGDGLGLLLPYAVFPASRAIPEPGDYRFEFPSGDAQDGALHYRQRRVPDRVRQGIEFEGQAALPLTITSAVSAVFPTSVPLTVWPWESVHVRSFSRATRGRRSAEKLRATSFMVRPLHQMRRGACKLSLLLIRSPSRLLVWIIRGRALCSGRARGRHRFGFGRRSSRTIPPELEATKAVWRFASVRSPGRKWIAVASRSSGREWRISNA
jgi:hypothetical protein